MVNSYPIRVRISTLILLILSVSCTNSDYRVERIDGGKATPLPLKFDSVSGVRNGDRVAAGVRFVSGPDTLDIDLAVHLAPAAECVSGKYHAVIAGQVGEGAVTCKSLFFQGGQDAPAIGGVFVLNGKGGIPLYRVTMRSTTMQRRFNP